MRTKNSIKNIIFGIGSQVTSTLVAFITRTVFINFLGAEYLGVEGLFSNILSMLSLANLGMESAIIFSLYKPLEEKNESEIKGYMNIYKVVYRIVGIFILITGLMLIPYLPNIIKDGLDIHENLIVIYMMFLLNSSISYLYIYKKSLLIANQQQYIISKIHTYFILISNILQIIMIITFRAYIPALLLQLVCRVLENIIISKEAEKKFLFLKDKNIKGNLTIKNKKKLWKNIYSMLLYKISGTVINSTDNIVISSFIGVAYVGIYSNYLLLISTIRTFISYIFSSLTASIGNLMVSKDENKKEFMFNQILFSSFWIYGFCAIAINTLVNDFINIWIGSGYLLDNFTVFIIVINFYTTGMQSAATMYRDTTGLFSVGKYRPIIAAIINLGVSIILAPKLKIAGVIIGTIISRLCVYFWFDPYIVYKNIFNKSSREYFFTYIKYTVIIFLLGISTEILSNMINIYNVYINFIIKALMCFVFPNIILIFIYSKNKHYIYIVNLLPIKVLKMNKKLRMH